MPRAASSRMSAKLRTKLPCLPVELGVIPSIETLRTQFEVEPFACCEGLVHGGVCNTLRLLLDDLISCSAGISYLRV